MDDAPAGEIRENLKEKNARTDGTYAGTFPFSVQRQRGSRAARLEAERTNPQGPTFRLLARHGIPWRHSRIPHRCGRGKRCRSGDRKRAPPSFLTAGGVFTQLEVFVSKFPSFCSSRYCSSVRSSTPMAAAMPTALSFGLFSFLESSASRS